MLRLPVTVLAEFVHRRGDLHARLDGRTRAEEGIATQRALQRDSRDTYQRERAVRLDVTLAGASTRLAGRIDGCDCSGPAVLIEEYKTSRADPELLHRHHASVHWAQAQLYGALLAREFADGRPVTLALIYAHPDTLAVRRFEQSAEAAELLTFLDRTLANYAAWLRDQQDHERQRDARLATLGFPFAEFRPAQRAMARRAFRALRDREHLLLEAPTGSGKTLATLYPAVRSLQASGYRRVLFLTSRSTGALAARDAVTRLDPAAGYLRHITIIARDKACFVPGTACEPDACRYARGYFDRARGAVRALLAVRDATPERVAEVAREHEVCPFELSLDAALWCDVVIGDYNYLFDPVVRLLRFDADPGAALLIDEAHQLAPRVRDMLSLRLARQEIRQALAEPVAEPLARRLRALDRALTTLRRRETLGEEQVIERPEPLLRAMQRLGETLTQLEVSLDQLPATRDLWFNCSRWLRSEAWYRPEGFLHLGEALRREVTVRLVCIDPGPYIQERLSAYGGHIRFSGTVSPLPLYARLHGEPQAPVERAGNPFAADQLRVLVVDGVSTYLRDRQRSLDDLVDLVANVVEAKAGHYLVAFPSFDYLEQCAVALAERAPALNLTRQTPAMDEAARQAFLDGFSTAADPLVGLVVLGGVFGESVDFTAARLTGILCVGIGLPPPSLTRRALQAHFDAQGEDGRLVAFQQPAMVKVLQMAGRLLRGPTDRGVLCLVDPRFREAGFQRFFPAHWQPSLVGRDAVAGELAAFWARQSGPLTSGDSKCAGRLTTLPGVLQDPP